MKLEAGKKYLTVDGSLVGPLYKEDGYFAFSIDNGKEYIQWNEHGNVIYYGGTGYNFRNEIELMIVKEYTPEKEVKSPVHTVTFNTILPGTYGNLEVVNYYTAGHAHFMKQKVILKVLESELDCDEMEKLVGDLQAILKVLKKAQKLLNEEVNNQNE